MKPKRQPTTVSGSRSPNGASKQATKRPSPGKRQLTGLGVEKIVFGRPRSRLLDAMRFDSRIERVGRLIEEKHSDPDMSPSEIVKSSGLSADHLNVLLREAIGFSVHDLLVRYRLLRAVELMQMRDRKLIAVAMDSGFGSQGALL
jgi:AraC-like DNA-binding protein